MNMLALRIEVLLRHNALQLLNRDASLCCLFLSLLAKLLFALGFPLLFDCQVQLEREHLRIVLIKVLTTADL